MSQVHSQTSARFKIECVHVEQQHRSIIMSWRVKNTSRIFLTAGLIFELELVQCSLWRLLKGAARKKKKRRSDTALSKTFFLLCLSLRNSAVHLSVYLRLINYILILILAPTEDYKLTSSLCEKINLSIWQKNNKKKDQLCQFGFILMAMVRRYKLVFLELASSALQFLYAH